MKKYLLSVFLFALIGMTFVAAVLSVRYWIAQDPNSADERQGQLLAYQDKKIRDLAPDSIDTVFVGDSTLGNAIDVQTFNANTNSRAVSLALTGSFGYGGALVQLQALAKRQSALRNVILFYSIDAMASGALPDGYFFSTPTPSLELPWSQQFELLLTYCKRLLDGPAAKDFILRALTGKLPPRSPPSLLEDDYIVSRAQISLANTTSYRVPQRPANSSTVFLALIARLCEKNHWNCVYLHGPVLSRSVASSPWADEYLADANRAIKAAGLQVKGGPVLMEDDERGDTVFHVTFEKREQFTKRYIAVLGDIRRAKSPK